MKFINFSNSKAQGTIEYLVIIAIVVVISLVVVGLLLGIFESNSDVSSTAQSISTQTLPVALNEAILGTGTDANGLIVLTNNTGNIIRDVRVVIDGKDHNYFGINIAQGNKVTFKLNFLEEPCPSEQTSIIKTISIVYTTRDGLTKTQKIENVTLQCNTNPTSTTPPKEEQQEQEEEEEPTTCTENWSCTDWSDCTNSSQTRTCTDLNDCGTTTNKPDETQPCTLSDTTAPTINVYTRVYDNNIRLYFTATDDNSIKQFDKNITGATAFVTANETQISENNYYVDFNNLNYSQTYTTCIRATDYNNNQTIKCDTNTTGTEPYVDPCPGQTELYGECYSNVVAYYPLEESSGTVIDHAGYDNNGTNSNATPNQSGKVGKSYYFNGTSAKITATPTGIPINSSDRTFCSWIKIDNDAISQERAIVGYGINTSGQMAYMGISSKYLRYSGSNNDYWTNSTLSPSEWTFVCISYQNSPMGLKLYINGVFDKNQTSLTVNTTSTEISIGYFDLGQQYWKGNLDEILIFNTALSETDINELYYNSGGTLVDQLRVGLVGYWPLENNVDDYSISGNYDLTYGTPNYITGVVEKGISTPGTNNLTYYPYRSSDDSIFDVSSSGSLTVCAWGKKTTTINEEAIVAKSDQSSPYRGWLLLLIPHNECGPLTNAVGLDLIDGSNRRLVRSTISFPQGEWQHICGVIDRTNQQVFIYQQGQDVTYTGGTGYCSRSLSGVGEINALRGLGIGVRDPNYIWNRFTGEIDEPTIWNRALSPSEIQSLYNNGNGLSLVQ